MVAVIVRVVLDVAGPVSKTLVAKRDDLTFWTTLLGLVVGIMTLLGMIYGFTIFIMRKFRGMLIEEVNPIIERVISPIRDEQRVVREELRIHMAVEQALLAQQTTALERHAKEDAAIQKSAEQWQEAVLTGVAGIQQAISDRPPNGALPHGDD